MDRIERFAHRANITAAIVATLALLAGSYQFWRTQELTQQNLRLQAETLNNDRESKAIEFFVKFNEIKKELAGKPVPTSDTSPDFWSHNLALSLTESVFRLTEGDPGWKKTVLWMLESQRQFLESVPQGCKTFAQNFRFLMQKTAPSMRCV